VELVSPAKVGERVPGSVAPVFIIISDVSNCLVQMRVSSVR
jgi:hypothetical protein